VAVVALGDRRRVHSFRAELDSLRPHRSLGLKGGDAADIVRKAQDSGVLASKSTNDIPGRYESFLHPEEKLAAIRAVPTGHRRGQPRLRVHAGTECITRNAERPRTPWGRNIRMAPSGKLTGEPAIFGGASAFWIQQGDEIRISF